jgi:nitroreductase
MSEIAPNTDIIRRRFSCRSYLSTPLTPEVRAALETFVAALPPGPFGTRSRFMIHDVTTAERGALRKLGTYGFVRGAPAYLIAACRDNPQALVDFGWQMEQIVLRATALGLGTCWLGGTFTRSSFAALLGAGPGEILPAVSPLGQGSEKPRLIDSLVRRAASSADRFAWEKLFFSADGSPLTLPEAGPLAEPLEMVRLAPSASNKQPWRVVQDGPALHFFLRRTPGYREGWLQRMLSVADLQRADLGIAMCHFELSARQAGLPGGWVQAPVSLTPALSDGALEYIATWRA